MIINKELLEYLESRIFHINKSWGDALDKDVEINKLARYKRLSLTTNFRFFYSKRFKIGNLSIVNGSSLFENDNNKDLFYTFYRETQNFIANFLVRDEEKYTFIAFPSTYSTYEILNKEKVLFNFWDLLELLDIDLLYSNKIYC